MVGKQEGSGHVGLPSEVVTTGFVLTCDHAQLNNAS